ncbi:universal stress protein [Oricola thermophila]|uniref:Universal stress protein n=1 Tax=Oricola thermophila TaxID=2742145 RepID=A0A6N1VC70_9HYPH|nr:universal stress protein [Oricola thermophila]QKV18143.1 universal stress protein [Oricola thermophila]
MGYATILVHLEFDGSNDARLQYATDLAGDLDAFLIGLTAAAVRPVHASELGVQESHAYSEELEQRIAERFAALKRQFYSVAGDGFNSGWRAVRDLPACALVDNARVADLIISGTPFGVDPGDRYRSVDPGDLACGAGRGVLFVGEGAVFRHPQCAVIGWKDTPEARRAVACALPFLKLAEKTVVVTLCADDGHPAEGPKDVARYLARHGIDADVRVVTGADGPEAFLDIVDREGADLTVTGAYGHSRMRERLFGGFTRALLRRSDLTRLMAG